jgi:hypothetical protein
VVNITVVLYVKQRRPTLGEVLIFHGKGPEKGYMSDYIVAVIIPLVALAITFGWVPFLDLICPPCNRSFKPIGLQRDELKRDLR